jgi:anti-sigma regulatory factor (Ser/Thr protein kinase)
MSEEDITVTVKDEGEGFPPLPTVEEAQVLDYLSEDGRGLKLAVLMCKTIEINKNLTTLVFEK